MDGSKRPPLGWPVVALAWALATGATAHEGHDHGAEAPPPLLPAGATPARLADGSVFLPKAVQRQLGIRTVLAEAGEFAGAVELAGKVIADPARAGQLQAPFDGRLEAGPRGLPLPGQAVRAGEVLAWIVPVSAGLERANQQALVAELDGSLAQARRNLARLEQLEGSVPGREIEAARQEVVSLAARRAAAASGLSGREPLVAPVSGVVSGLSAGAGQVLEARATVLEVIDPARLMVEALVYDPALAAGLGDARLAAGAGEVRLPLAGVGRSLREQALPVLYRVPAEAAAGLAVGQPVALTARTRATHPGVAVPARAVLREGGEHFLWLHAEAEGFVRRPVSVAPLDGRRLRVTAGLTGGERVVTEGASLLGQVR
jgi:hypothetical protein